MPSRPSLPSALLCLSLAAGAVLPAGAQGTRADYDRAAGLAARFRGKVVRDRIVPRWLDADRLWYSVDLPGGKREAWLVDARTGAKTPHTGAVPGAAAGAGLTPRSPAGVRSGANGEETEIVFRNRTNAPVKLFWLDAAGERREYGIVAPGAERAQHTFAGHAWLITRADGTPLVAFIAEPGSRPAVITGEAPPAGRPAEAGRPNRPNRPNGGEPQARGGTSPDGKLTILVRENNLVIRENPGGKETPLTTEGTAADGYSAGELYWSPDSRRLVALRTKRAQEHKVHIVESSPRDQLQPKLHTLDYLKPGDQIAHPRPHLFDLATRKEIEVPDTLFPTPWSLNGVRWDADSRRFSFHYNQRGHQVLRVIAVDAETGAARAIVDEQSKTFIDYADKGYWRPLPRTSEILWMSERDGWNHLYLYDARYDAKSGAVKSQITRGPWVVRAVDRVDEEKRQIWFRAGGIYPDQDPYYVHFCRINFDGTGLVKLTAGDGTHAVEYSPDGKYLTDTYSRVDMAPVTELRRTEDGSLVTVLEKGDLTALTAAGWRAPERFVSKARDGVTDIHGVIFRPTQLDPARKYPVLEDIYAGPQSSFVPKGFLATHSQQALAELGFIVVKIDGMGTSNRSKAFHDVCWKNLGDAGFPDRILWMKAAAAKYSYMDLDRVGIFGGSAGGQNSLRALLAHPEFYKAAVSGCGCHDNRMDKIWWNELWMGWPIGPHYDEQSNVTQAHKLQGKLLLIVGEMDTNVDPASTMQVVNALVKADKDFDLLVVPGAGHGMGGVYGARRMQDFFVRHLLGVEPRK